MRLLPRASDPLVEGVFAKYRRDRYERTLFVSTSPLVVEPDYGNVFDTHARHVFADPYNYSEFVRRLAPRRLREARRAVATGRVTIDRAVSLWDHGSRSWWHLVDDVLPRVAEADQLGFGDAVFLVPEQLWSWSPFQRLLRSPGLSGRQVRPHLAVERVGQLLFGSTASLVPENWDRSRALISGLCAGGRSPRRLFVPRTGGDARRRLILPTPVERALLARGFHVLDPSGRPADEQVGAFLGVDAVVAVHGAALANWAMATGTRTSPQGTVIEIFHPDVIRPHFAVVAAHRGWSHRSLVGQDNGIGPMTIEGDAFLAAVDSLL